MSDDHDDGHDHPEDGHDHPEHDYDLTRTTAPQQAFTTSQVGTGFAVLAIGLLVTFGVAFALV